MAETTDTTDKTTRTGVADIRQAVETANAEDERSKKDADDDEDDDDDSDEDGEGDDDGAEDKDQADKSEDADEGEEDDEEDSEDEDNPDDKQSQTKRHFDQYKGDGTDKSYISNLEKAHQSSITEAVSLKQQLNQATSRTDAILRAAAADPELATKLNAVINGAGTDDGEGDGADKGAAAENPFVRDLQAQWTKKSEEEIDKFIEANPEVASDPKIKADVQHWMGIFSNEHFTRTGRLLSGGEAMAQAYKHLGLENKLEKQNLAAGAKKIVAPSRPRGKVKKSDNGQKPSFTPDQIAMAKAMGKDENWLAKNAK